MRFPITIRGHQVGIRFINGGHVTISLHGNISGLTVVVCPSTWFIGLVDSAVESLQGELRCEVRYTYERQLQPVVKDQPQIDIIHCGGDQIKSVGEEFHLDNKTAGHTKAIAYLLTSYKQLTLVTTIHHMPWNGAFPIQDITPSSIFVQVTDASSYCTFHEMEPLPRRAAPWARKQTSFDVLSTGMDEMVHARP